MTPAELARQYNARAAIPEHPGIFARWAARSALARQERHCEPDYYYGATPAETLDVFPAGKPGAPLLVFDAALAQRSAGPDQHLRSTLGWIDHPRAQRGGLARRDLRRLGHHGQHAQLVEQGLLIRASTAHHRKQENSKIL